MQALPPFQPVTLLWHDVSSEVPIPGFKDPRVVLSHVSGWARVRNKLDSADFADFDWTLVFRSGMPFPGNWSTEIGEGGRCCCIVVQYFALYCTILH